MLARIIRRALRGGHGITWMVLAGAGLALFALTWAGLAVFEPESNEAIHSARNAWWYFMVTATTVGYGDMAAQSTGGRISVALFAQIGGIALLGACVGKGAEAAISVTRRRARGLKDFSGAVFHTVMIGWRKDVTPKLMEMHHRDTCGAPIILVAKTPEENPAPEWAEYVRGESGADPRALRRAGVAKASRVLVYCATDEETLAALVYCCAQNKEAHVVAMVSEQDYADLVYMQFGRRVKIVTPMRTSLLARELMDPGSAEVAEDIFSNLNSGQTQFSMEVPAGGAREWEDVREDLAARNGLGIAVRVHWRDSGKQQLVVNPQCDVKVLPGDIVYYLAEERLDGSLRQIAA